MTHQSQQALLNLAGLVAAHNIRQVELAAHLNVKQPSVSEFLSGKADPRLSTVFNYLNAVNALAGTAYTLADICPGQG
jgi:predicted transcriptional regulator